jgi:hypothetical protein
MGHPMFTYDPEMTDAIFEYCRTRLSLDPIPLDYGGLGEDPAFAVEGLINAEGNDPVKVLELFANHLAKAIVSIDSPRFLAFIPNAPTKAALLFDMVLSSCLAQRHELHGVRRSRRRGEPAPRLSRRASGHARGLRRRVRLGRVDREPLGARRGARRWPPAPSECRPRHLRAVISGEAHSSVGAALHLSAWTPSTWRPPITA